MVGQDTFFFDETILFNLQAVNSIKTESEIEDACRKANILEEVLKFPEGFQTRLTNNATNISYGQRQRLAIARILLLDYEILLCDEILFNVDYDSKNKIIESLRFIVRDKIVIFVTHDSGLIQENDAIVFSKYSLSDGSTHSFIKKSSETFEDKKRFNASYTSDVIRCQSPLKVFINMT